MAYERWSPWRRVVQAASITACLIGSSLQAAPDEAALGSFWGYPRGSMATAHQEGFRVGSFSAMHRIYPSRAVAPATAALALERGEARPIRYQFSGATRSLQDYLDSHRSTGLLILHDGKVLHERYQYARKDSDLFYSFSMAKSVTALLVGIAQARGHISSLDDPAQKYVPELQGSAYGATTLRQLLRMSSGVRFTEDYSGSDDNGRLWDAMFRFGRQPLEVLAGFNQRDAAAGSRFKYAGGETQVLCHVLRRATARTVAALTEEWLWQPIGAEAAAAWTVGRDDVEACMAGFNATLRDYARLGLMLANGGRVGDREVVPASFLAEATQAERQPEGFKPGQPGPFGYGYQFWLSQLAPGVFSAVGIYGQTIMIDPALRLVVVHTAAWRAPSSASEREERTAFLLGVRDSLSGAVKQ
jgi:CubicO group peptidase (beta-lactamase class C family)